MMRRGFRVIISSALIAATICSCASPEGQEHSATVIEAVNKVDALPRPEDDWQPAVVDMAIYGGGQVRTGAASSARLELLEGVVRIWSESIFTVRECTTRQERLVTTLFLQAGRLWAHLTTSQPHEFTVETASAVAAVRDTRFSVKVDHDQTMLVSVAEGEVVLTAQEKGVVVLAGQQATVEPGQPPSPPEPMSDEERDLWVTEGEMPELASLLPPTPTLTPTPTPTVTPTPVPPTATPTFTPTPTPQEQIAEIPNVVGLTPEEAESKLKEAGFGARLGEDGYSDEVSVGYIYKQEPGAGELYDLGNTVVIYRSLGTPTPTPRRVIPEGVYVISAGTARMLKGGSEVFQESSISRIERQVRMVDERTVELEISETYENPFWTGNDWLERVDVYTGELVSTTLEDGVAYQPTGETQVITMMGRSVAAHVFKESFTSDMGDGWTETCEGTQFRHPESGFMLKWEGACDVFNPEGQWWGTETSSGQVIDTNLPLVD
jgi:hypothetical protein